MDEQNSHTSAKPEEELSVSNVSVQIVNAEEKLEKKILARKNHGKSKSKRKIKRITLWNFQNTIILFTLVLFVIGVITWTLLWLFIVEAENKDALYFVGLFRVANIEFLPEYRQKESREFLSVAQNVQQVDQNYLESDEETRFSLYSSGLLITAITLKIAFVQMAND